MKEITRAAAIRGINQEERTAEFLISNETVDRHGTVFKLDGWDLSVYERNPIVCYNHQSSGSDPDTIIGTSRVYRDGDALVGEVTFEEEGENVLADKIWKKINKGILKMASVGARVHDYRWGDKAKGEDGKTIYFTRQELLEWSVVSVGSNPDAFKRGVDEIREELGAIEQPEEMDDATKRRVSKWKVKKITSNIN